MGDTYCRVCQEPLPHGRELSWPVIIGMFFGIWRGYVYMPGGFSHRRCFEEFAGKSRKALGA